MRIQIIYIIILICISANYLNGQTYQKKLLELNTEYSEFGPAFYKDEITFCSDRKNNYIVILDEQDGNYLSDIYISIKDSLGNQTGSDIFSQGLTTLYNEGPMCFTNNYKTVYFTRSQKVFKKIKDITRKKNTLGIFKAELIDGKYSNIKTLGFVKQDFNYAHPTISEDGNTLYFISDMKGGMGNSDIYFCGKIDSVWSEPQNLGNVINSSGKEMFPFIHKSDRLYFSSDRNNGKGGLDIYYSDKIESGWSNLVALDTNFNTTFDDFGYICNSSMDTGYFCSNKNGSDDIFSIVFEYPVFSECDSLEYENLCFDLYEENSIFSDSLPLEYEWDMGDGTKHRGASISHCFAEPGFYTINLNVINTISSEIFKNDASYDLNIEKINQAEILIHDTVIVSKSIYIKSSIKRLPSLSKVQYFWDMGDGTKVVGEYVIHKYLMEGMYTIELGVIGTNSYGEIEYNCVNKRVLVNTDN